MGDPFRRGVPPLGSSLYSGVLRTMKSCSIAAALGVAAAVFCVGAAQAGEWLLGVYAHDVTFIGEAIGVGAPGREEGTDLHLGVRSARIGRLKVLGRPQAHMFVSLNSENTSNFAAAGLSWPIALTERLYVRPGLGLAITDGEVDLPPVNAPGLSPEEIERRLKLYRSRIDFGSKVLLQPELALGLRVDNAWSAELSWVHISNGQVFAQGKNQGMDAAGVRLLRRF